VAAGDRRDQRGGLPVPVLAGTVLAGGALAVQARVNGALIAPIGSAAVAALVAYGVASAALLPLVAGFRLSRRLPRGRRRGPVRWYWWLGGLAGAGVMAATAAGVPRVGVALVSTCLVAGATAGGLVADWAGIGPGRPRPPSLRRLLGAGLAVGAVGVGTIGQRAGHGQPLLVLLVFAAGLASAGQQTATGQLARVTGDARVAALVSSLVAAGGLAAVVGSLAAAGRLPRLSWPASAWMYLGGLAVALYGTVAAAAVRRLGVLLVSLATVSGQLLAAVALDAVVPAAGRLRATAVLGALLTLAAVGVVTTSHGAWSARAGADVRRDGAAGTAVNRGRPGRWLARRSEGRRGPRRPHGRGRR